MNLRPREEIIAALTGLDLKDAEATVPLWGDACLTRRDVCRRKCVTGLIGCSLRFKS